ncbi:MAG: hypothetical protein MZW92_25440 [Comamonadaceae bacterium]|nr:hypothetical protein [Comamonadaceae bacterium]
MDRGLARPSPEPARTRSSACTGAPAIEPPDPRPVLRRRLPSARVGLDPRAAGPGLADPGRAGGGDRARRDRHGNGRPPLGDATSPAWRSAAASTRRVFVGFMAALQALTPIAGHHFGARPLRGDRRRRRPDPVAVAVPDRDRAAAAGHQRSVAAPDRRRAGRGGGLVAVPVGGGRRPAGGAGLARLHRHERRGVATRRHHADQSRRACRQGAAEPAVHLRRAAPLPALGGAGCGVATALIMWLMLLAHWLLWRLDPFYRRFQPSPHAPRGPVWRRQTRAAPARRAQRHHGADRSQLVHLHRAAAGAASARPRWPATRSSPTSSRCCSCCRCRTASPAASWWRRRWARASRRGPGAPRCAATGSRWAPRWLVVAVVYLLRAPLVAQFTRDAQVATVALSLVGLAMLFHLFDAVQGIAAFLLRGYKIALAPMLIHSVSLWAVGLAGGYWLAYHPPSAGRSARRPASGWPATVGLVHRRRGAELAGGRSCRAAGFEAQQ